MTIQGYKDITEKLKRFSTDSYNVRKELGLLTLNEHAEELNKKCREDLYKAIWAGSFSVSDLSFTGFFKPN